MHVTQIKVNFVVTDRREETRRFGILYSYALRHLTLYLLTLFFLPPHTVRLECACEEQHAVAWFLCWGHGSTHMPIGPDD